MQLVLHYSICFYTLQKRNPTIIRIAVDVPLA